MSQELTHRVAILADDLTSAADGAGPFVARGLSAHIGRQSVPDADWDVCAIDVASRSVSEMEAGVRMEHFAGKLRGAQVLLKTVDSTLRGHIRVEIETALRASGRRRLVFAPAFPEAGRTTLEGVQLVKGVPVHLSSYGKDPVHPARTSKLRELVPPGTEELLIFNAETQGELNRQVTEVERPESVLWVGSPGLAQALAARIGTEVATKPPVFPSAQAVLVVVGSANAVSHRQAVALKNEGVELLIVPRDRKAEPSTVLNALADEAAKKLATGVFGALIATGGDTMEAILARAGIESFSLLGEIEPGFPVGAAETAGQGILLAMKAGGFGDDETLQRAVRRLTLQTKELTA